MEALVSLFLALAMVALVYLLGFPAYRAAAWAIARWRPRDRPRRCAASLPSVLWLVSLVIVGMALPLYVELLYRSGESHTLADLKTFAYLVDEHRARTGRLPAALADLAVPVAESQGKVTEAPARRASDFELYTYEPRPDGGYRITTADGHPVARPGGWRVLRELLFETWTEADLRELVAAVERYRRHMGVLPVELGDVTSRRANARGETVGAFAKAIPAPRPGRSAYRYERRADGGWSVSTTGDGYTFGMRLAPDGYARWIRIER